MRFPHWFTALTVLFLISNLFLFGLLTLFFPHLTFPNSGDGAIFPIQFMAARHIAFVLPLFHGLVRKNVMILRTMYTIFLVMSIIDIVLLGVYGYNIPLLGSIPFIGNLPTVGKVAVGVSMFWLPIGACLAYLRSLPAAE